MKKRLIIILIFGSMNILNSQNSNIEDLMKIKEKLILEKNQIIDSIKKIDIKLTFLNSKKGSSEILGTDFIKTTVTLKASIKNKPSIFGNEIGIVPKGKLLEVYDYYGGFWSVKYDSIIGYLSDTFISNRRELSIKRDAHKDNEVINKFGNEIGSKIINHRIWKGMSSEMAKLSIGNPKDINQTVGDWGIHEQWVYGNRYLYFENGILKSWQD